MRRKTKIEPKRRGRRFEAVNLALQFSKRFVAWSLSADQMLDDETLDAAFALATCLGVERKGEP